jgi:hypothetical protein
MVSTRGQLRERERSGRPGREGEDQQERRRTPSVPAQFRFIPPRYAPRDRELAPAEGTAIPTPHEQPTSTPRNANQESQNSQMNTPTPETVDIPALADNNISQMYKNIFDSLTVDQQQALLRGRVHLPPDPSHNLRASAAGPGRDMYIPGQGVIETRAYARVIPMRPLDIGREWALDYTSPTTIKLYNKAMEAVKGEASDGKFLYSWLARVHDKARAFSWLSILTINGKILTKSYADLSMEEVRQHAQKYQNEARRGAQNAEQMLTCLQASITRIVYNRIQQLSQKYTIIREPEKEEIWDGVCYLKVIIDSYHVNTRSSKNQKKTSTTANLYETSCKRRCSKPVYPYKELIGPIASCRRNHYGPIDQPNGSLKIRT